MWHNLLPKKQPQNIFFFLRDRKWETKSVETICLCKNESFQSPTKKKKCFVRYIKLADDGVKEISIDRKKVLF